MDSKNGKHLTVSCKFCMKQMRSDNLNRHIESEHKEPSKVDWNTNLNLNQDVYYKNVEFGQHIFESIQANEIDQFALSEYEASCLRAYTAHREIRHALRQK
jgi:hypothetical protein